MSELDGVLPVDKPEGPTSHDAVAVARRALRTRRIGHTGTLDPFASGLLLLCLGPSTRLAEYLTALPKRYEATLRLGETTDTDDLTGEVTGRSEGWRDLPADRIRAAVAAQAGALEQLPPTYSAKKVGGERMYAAARRGERVERAPVRVVVHSIELTRLDPPEVDFRVHCSSGTYIRAIARDVGEALGVGAHLTRLRRTEIGGFRVDEALALDALDPDGARPALLSPADALGHLPRVMLDAELAGQVAHGRAVEAPASAPADTPIALLSADGALLAVAERRGERLQPRKVFA